MSRSNSPIPLYIKNTIIKLTKKGYFMKKTKKVKKTNVYKEYGLATITVKKPTKKFLESLLPKSETWDSGLLKMGKCYKKHGDK